ncbi:unnamed protein product [Acanthoscelides obtectus]|uniref:TIL domain-containing protein n=1 Tax=Acanthoscelides obtectus TaxID=200917 RepID=A0A9P0KFM3_ACAOB|nr:unnamed protein product [Acanthoscelides obtectus]CAK1666724.1 hypothetical protein AOBTE_LOCUS25456 [Acanthoscelides obtectus]
MKSFVLSILALFLILTVIGNASAKCRHNETVPGCRPCSVTCADQHKICSKICIHNYKCYCKPGYLKKHGKCVPISQC